MIRGSLGSVPKPVRLYWTFAVEGQPRQHHSSGRPVAMSSKKDTGGPPVTRRRQSEVGFATDSH